MLALVVLQTAVQVGIGDFPGQVQGAQHQLARLVPGVVGAMTEEQALRMETAHGPADMVTQGQQTGFGHGTGPRSSQKGGGF
ncbi:hypothetical protein D9M71_446630 [compost metagenome]